MVLAFGVVGLVVALSMTLAVTNRLRADETPPVFVTDGRCPVCGHDIREHYVAARLSGVYKGCDVARCGCDVSITRIPGPH